VPITSTGFAPRADLSSVIISFSSQYSSEDSPVCPIVLAGANANANGKSRASKTERSGTAKTAYVPSLRDNNVVKRRVLVAKARQPNPKNHFVEIVWALLGNGPGLSSTCEIQTALRKSSRRSGKLVVPKLPNSD
jgi:hypothetical protein